MLNVSGHGPFILYALSLLLLFPSLTLEYLRDQIRGCPQEAPGLQVEAEQILNKDNAQVGQQEERAIEL